ncbi:MAG: FAD-dependent oxidoreductase [Roseiflexaceae bacterium]
MTHPLGSAERPARIAIIGAGPAGFYTAEALLKQKNLNLSVDLFNRLPTPFGLVREGVAPDHQEIKAVTRIYQRLLDDPRLRYFGNVTFGADLSLDDLRRHYDQVVFSVGAQADRRMGIPGEDLDGSFAATSFVGWYNGHPDYRDMQFDLSTPTVVVVGNGNVAMDVTRILISDPERLATTDIADHALEALRASQVREVIMLGRRGPVQASFTNPELKEFGELDGVDVIINPADLELDPASIQALEGDKMAQRNVDLLRVYAAKTDLNAPRRIVMRFLASPIEVLGSDGRMTGIKIERNRLASDATGGLRAKGTGEFETISAGMVLRSVGYRGVPLPGVPFDEATFTIPNVNGRVLSNGGGETLSGLYTVGWVKRGPSGVIGTNKADAVATVAGMLEDLGVLDGAPDEGRDPAVAEALIRSRKPNYVSVEGWKKLDAYETARGAEQGRPRVKLTKVADMLEVIG